MIILILALVALMLWGVVETIRQLRGDGVGTHELRERNSHALSTNRP
ncbi:hypothetical protein [Leifsonia sp. A12D58]